MPIFFLDMVQVPGGAPLSKWLAEPHLFLQVGSAWNESNADSNYQIQTLSEDYDGLFIAESHLANGIRLTGR